MKKYSNSIIILVLSCIVVFSSCASIPIPFTHTKVRVLKECKETKKTIALAKQRTDYTALTIDDLKKLLIEDTTHYKLVTFYSPCCGPCLQHMSYTDPQVFIKVGAKDVKWYYILENTGGIKDADEALDATGITRTRFPKYYLRDDNTNFIDKSFPNFNKIANYIFEDNVKVDDLFGIPVNFIVSKDGKLKKDCYVYSNGKKRIHPTIFYDIIGKNMNEIDFNKIDTIKIEYSAPICTPDG